MEHLCRYKDCLNYGAVVARVEIPMPVEEEDPAGTDGMEDIEVNETKNE